MVSLFVVLFANMAGAQLLTAVEDFPERIPNVCADGCSEQAVQLVQSYDQAQSFAVPPGTEVYTGRCEMQGGPFGKSAFILMGIKDGIVSVRLAGPTVDYKGDPRLSSWEGMSAEALLAKLNFDNADYTLNVRENFAFVDSRRANNDKQFVLWLRGQGEAVYAMGYFSLNSAFQCQLKVHQPSFML